MKTKYAIALTAATLSSSPIIASDSGINNIYTDVNYITDLESTTSSQIADHRRYLNSIMIKESFCTKLTERKLYKDLPSNIKNIFYNISKECSSFDVKEVYADYSPVSNAIRIDMVIDDDFLLIVRKTIEEKDDNCIAVSLSRGNENYLVDYLDLNDLIKEVNYCIKG